MSSAPRTDRQRRKLAARPRATAAPCSNASVRWRGAGVEARWSSRWDWEGEWLAAAARRSDTSDSARTLSGGARRSGSRVFDEGDPEFRGETYL